MRQRQERFVEDHPEIIVGRRTHVTRRLARQLVRDVNAHAGELADLARAAEEIIAKVPRSRAALTRQAKSTTHH